ncbi:MAG TPA: xanthine dehydrogenase family protein molybdopterin-binding subunit [Acidimicrobiales bacterium]
MPGARFVGQRVARNEDLRFLTGNGKFVDDLVIPNVLHAAYARSDVARGRIVSIDIEEAKAMPGVVAVYLAADLNHLVQEYTVDGEMLMAPRPYRVLAEGDVKCVGEPLAMVVAESRYLAEDAVEAIVVEIDPEKPVVSIDEAVLEDAKLVHPDMTENNLYNVMPAAPNEALDDAFATAPHVFTETFKQHRYLTVPMETKGIVSSWEPFSEQLTVWVATQGPHTVRSFFSRALGLDTSQVRVNMPDVGGSFGLKMNQNEEELSTALVSRILGRPIKWIQDRRENLMADEHPRGDWATITMATDDDGKILACKVEFTESAGAYPSPFSSASILSCMVFPGPYRMPNFGYSARSVYTNTMGRGSYRGPWMIETVVREQMLDVVAGKLGIDPVEFRRRNLVLNDEVPHDLLTGMVIDQLTVDLNLDQALKMVDYEAFRREQEEARAEGRLLGLGVSLVTEPTAMAFAWMSTDAAHVRINGGGKVDVVTTAASHGQSYETTMAQIVADELGVEPSDVRIIQPDTDNSPVGPGTGGSRSLIPMTAAAMACDELKERMRAIVAHALEASPDDLEFVDGRVQVAGSPEKGMTLKEVAAKAYADPHSLPEGVPLGLEAEARFTTPGGATWANACHICTCEVDPVTGEVTLLRYIVSEDCGTMVNPNVVEGQIAGGVVQGIGGVLYEHMKYDEDGNPLASTFVDYLLPTAAEVVDIEYGHVETPAPTNPHGIKGLGEGGAIASPPAVINAVADALRPLGVEVRDQPLGPADIVDLIVAAGGAGRRHPCRRSDAGLARSVGSGRTLRSRK